MSQPLSRPCSRSQSHFHTRLRCLSLWLAVLAGAALLAAAFCAPALANPTGDFNGDGTVDAIDLGILIGGWNQARTSGGGLLTLLDLNGDGVVNHADVATFLDAYLHEEVDILAGATPPPTTWPTTGPVTFNYNGRTETWTAYPGQVLLTFKGAPPTSDVAALIEPEGGKVLAALPALGYYLIGVPVGSEGAFISAVSADSRVYVAVPHLLTYYDGGPLVRPLQTTANLPAGVDVIDGCDQQHGADVKAVFANNGVPVAKCLDDSGGGPDGVAPALTDLDFWNLVDENKTSPLLVNISSGAGLSGGLKWDDVDQATQQVLIDEYEARLKLLLGKLTEVPASWRTDLVITFCAGNNHAPLDTILADLRKDPGIADVLSKNVLIVGSLNQSFSNYASASDPDFVWTSNSEAAQGTSFAAPYALGLIYELMKDKGMTAGEALAYAKSAAAADPNHELSTGDLFPQPAHGDTYAGAFSGDTSDTANGSTWSTHIAATITLTISGDGTIATPYSTEMYFDGDVIETLKYCNDPGGCDPGGTYPVTTSGQGTSTRTVACTAVGTAGSGSYTVYLTNGSISSDGTQVTATVRFSAPGALDSDVTQTVTFIKQAG